MTPSIKKLIHYLNKLPGIGPRQAARLAVSMLEWHALDLTGFAQALAELKNQTRLCSECFNISENEQCSICTSPKRDQTRLAVVEKIVDLTSIEKTGNYSGLYHVLGGALSPAYGITPDRLTINELKQRVQRLQNDHGEVEVILATNPTTHGETTALYLEQELQPLSVKITRLARGLAAGSSLEYADEITLANAFKNRK